MKLAVVTEIAAPYRIPLFNALAERLSLEAVFLAEADPRRDYPFYREEFRFGWHVLPGLHLRRGLRWLALSRGLRRRLRLIRPDALVVGGWNQPAFWQAMRWARRNGVPFVLWVESTTRDARATAAPLDRLRRLALHRADAVLVPGRAAADYARSLGVDARRVWVAANAVDLTLFAEQVEQEREERDELRREFDLEGCVFLSVSRLSPEKGVDVLARAFHGVDGRLVLAGDGPERAVVEAAAPPGTIFLGHVGRDDLPRWYAAADAFVMPSRSETWGMAMNEAAAAGLPLVASEAPGAGYELIDPEVNGFRVPVEDVDALRATLQRVAADPGWRERAGVRTLELAKGFTPEAWAARVEELVERLYAERNAAR